MYMCFDLIHNISLLNRYRQDGAMKRDNEIDRDQPIIKANSQY
jgi:hypothetical protein